MPNKPHRISNETGELGCREWRITETKDFGCIIPDYLLHRMDGPAAEWDDGSKQWYHEGLLHRMDGPASEMVGGSCKWYCWDIGLGGSKAFDFLDVLNQMTKDFRFDPKDEDDDDEDITGP